MRRFTRVIAVLAGLTCLIAGAVTLLLEVRFGASRPLPTWWLALVSDSSSHTLVAAVGAALLALVLLVLAACALSRPRHASVVEFRGEGSSVARIDARALERMLQRRVAEGIPGLIPEDLEIRPEEFGWGVRLTATYTGSDLLGAHSATKDLLAADLQGIGGIELAALDVVVTGLPSHSAPASSGGA